MKQLRSVLTVILAIALMLSAFALADDYVDTQVARANQKLSLRELPTTHSTFVGSYPMQNKAITLSGKCWDTGNGIWWLECSFEYKGGWITGWTGAKRFDSSTYDLNALQEYDLDVDCGVVYPIDEYYYGLYDDDDFEIEEYCCDDENPYEDYDYNYVQYGRANQKLSLRSGPSTKTRDLGTYRMEGEYVELTAKHWDSVNSIWWLECGFEYKGGWITGWTGAKRFDSSTYDLNALPEN